MKALHHSLRHSVFLGAMLLAVPSLNASLLVYEGFDYGGSAIANIGGTTTTGTGVTGTWTTTNVLPGGGSASSGYQTGGLSFGSNFASTTGGALVSTTKYSGTNAQATASIKLNVTTTGTVWSSYLVNYTNLDNATNGHALQTVATDAAVTTTQLASVAFSNASGAAARTIGAKFDTSTTSSTALSLATGTTYLYIAKFTNVGVALGGGTNGVATVWLFDQAGYDTWFTTGLGLEANLGTYALKTVSDTATSGTFNFNTSSYAAFRTDAPDTNNFQSIAVFDELRYGTDLVDVISLSSVPEPSTYALLAGSIGLAGSIIVRRRTNRIP